MPTKLILEDWEDYDNKKITDKRDANDFSCSEPWEAEYLRQKIKNVYPNLPDFAIRVAIQVCCSETRPPRLRKQFVECVAKKLGIEIR